MPASTDLPARADIQSIPIDTAKILRLRTKLGYSQEQAAKLAGLHGRQKWNDIERGRKPNLTVATLESVAKALGVKARDLLK